MKIVYWKNFKDQFQVIFEGSIIAIAAPCAKKPSLWYLWYWRKTSGAYFTGTSEEARATVEREIGSDYRILSEKEINLL